jgi:hypothetical protein
MASAQIVFPVPGGPAKLKASASPVGCRSAEAPAVEDEIVLCYLRQGDIAICLQSSESIL